MRSGYWGGLAAAGLAASALMLGLAPLLLPASYSWVVHTTSESAAQGVSGAWLARGGFLSFGVTVVMIAYVARGRWGRWAVGLHTTFGLLMVAAGIFSARPWDGQVPFSELEDLLHSVAATVMGFAFAVGVTVVALERWRRGSGWQVMDLAAVTASVALPLAMAGATGLTGVFQRAMFLVAYVWYGREAVRSGREAHGGAGQRPRRPAPSP
jgi:hypothetical protein